MEDTEPRRFAERLLEPEGSVYFFPIRHHSPTCAFKLASAFRELRPKHVLIEMPSDFSHLIPLLRDPLLRPPAAIVAILDPEQAGLPHPIAYWPVSATAPEYAAIRAAAECGASIQFFDLASNEREMLQPLQDDVERNRPPGAPIVLTDDALLDHSGYVRALVERSACRDFNELWDRLFEARLTDPNWRKFFADVGVYCLLAQQTRSRDELERDGTLARERCMAIHLARALESNSPPLAVVTGGFHTPALLDPTSEAKFTGRTLRSSRSYLVRFSHQRLDALNGYAAGMPSPRYYELLAAAVERGEANPFRTSAEEILLDLAAHLRSERPGLAPNVPGIVEALRHAATLADLRGLPGPLRSELLDAVRATLVQEGDPRFAAPLLEELALRLTGTGIGDVPPSAGSPPLVEAARHKARSFGFTVTDSVTRRRELDIHRNRRHRESSRFLHAMAILDAEFGRLEHGADYSIGVDLDTLFEVWSYAWSPLVEARLIEAAADGDDVEGACAAALRRHASRLTADGQGRNAAQACNLAFAAARAGVGSALLDELLQLAEAEIAEDPNLARVAMALRNLLTLWCARPVLGLTKEPRLGRMLGVCYRRAVFLLPTIAGTRSEQVAEAAQALIAIRDILTAAAALSELDAALFSDAIDALIEAELPPLLEGVTTALAVQFGNRSFDFLATRIAGAMAGAAVEPSDRAAPLAGLLMVSPASLRRMDDVVAAIDTALGGLEESQFVQLLPHLREAFTVLGPSEAESLGAAIASRHGLSPDALKVYQPDSISEPELQRNLDNSQKLLRLWKEDGLDTWLQSEDRG